MNYIQILYLCILKQLKSTITPFLACCELHSNLVSLHSETTKTKMVSLVLQLWITFKSCIFAFWNNLRVLPAECREVVNYIQILYLCILKQRDNHPVTGVTSCELHSNLVSLHSETTESYNREEYLQLWITFKSCIFAFWNNFACRFCWSWQVVNYIQILYLCILKQQSRLRTFVANSCELHSNLVSLHSETTNIEGVFNIPCCELHSNLVSLHSETTRSNVIIRKDCCELHSNLVSLHSETTIHISLNLWY